MNRDKPRTRSFANAKTGEDQKNFKYGYSP